MLNTLKLKFLLKTLLWFIPVLLLAIFCHEQYREKVSIRRVRQLRIQIQREARSIDKDDPAIHDVKEHMKLHAKT